MADLILWGLDGKNLLGVPKPQPDNPPAHSQGEAVTITELETLDIAANGDFAFFEAGFTGTAMASFSVNTASTTGVLSVREKSIGRGMVDTTSQLLDGVQVSTGQLKQPTWPITKGVTYALRFSVACSVTVKVIGIPGIVADPPSGVTLKAINATLVTEQTIDWNGTETSVVVNVPLNSYTGIKIAVDNTGCNVALTTTFEEFVSSLSDNRQWYDGSGAPVGSFQITASTKGTFGPYDSFPKFLGGQIRLAAASAPSNTQVTKITVVGVD